ncbi:TRIO and F-actin-binding protein-like [Acetobacter orientalis]|uniref:TRIO and F-actin-binding protein-like, partial n=1 Tax=Acetobacter orientalis TaxID=146474 RepID=A0A2Z5ZJY3_9PROT|nr:TRIO and F-actin-binding protein-like [Acetobacter orientalis]
MWFLCLSVLFLPLPLYRGLATSLSIPLTKRPPLRFFERAC